VDGKAETQYPIQKHSLYCFTTWINCGWVTVLAMC
jgi:hypothetical protein